MEVRKDQVLQWHVNFVYIVVRAGRTFCRHLDLVLFTDCTITGE